MRSNLTSALTNDTVDRVIVAAMHIARNDFETKAASNAPPGGQKEVFDLLATHCEAFIKHYITAMRGCMHGSIDDIIEECEKDAENSAKILAKLREEGMK